MYYVKCYDLAGDLFCYYSAPSRNAATEYAQRILNRVSIGRVEVERYGV